MSKTYLFWEFRNGVCIGFNPVGLCAWKIHYKTWKRVYHFRRLYYYHRGLNKSITLSANLSYTLALLFPLLMHVMVCYYEQVISLGSWKDLIFNVRLVCVLKFHKYLLMELRDFSVVCETILSFSKPKTTIFSFYAESFLR